MSLESFWIQVGKYKTRRTAFNGKISTFSFFEFDGKESFDLANQMVGNITTM